MRPMLAGLELPQVQEVRVVDTRAVAEHHPTGGDASRLQDLGRVPTVVTVHGVATHPDAPMLVEQLKVEMQAGEPVPFVADITTDSTIADVIVDDVGVRQLAGRPDRFAYALTLREHIAPVEPEDLSVLDADLLDDAAGVLDDLVDGLGGAAAFAAGLERFGDALGELLERLSAFRADLAGDDT